MTSAGGESFERNIQNVRARIINLIASYNNNIMCIHPIYDSHTNAPRKRYNNNNNIVIILYVGREQQS